VQKIGDAVKRLVEPNQLRKIKLKSPSLSSSTGSKLPCITPAVVIGCGAGSRQIASLLSNPEVML
jgi:hypothetical protein